ncbi:hypothetical protein GUJ93_ZPchr0014g46908 [Zizania palustris]|uniref:Uncharacterized protein n=1 Tax=Zizania palustris TaxID=103762 RepID=A0A8J5TKY2_ZIZPA|nr:hypothetical protein GUJ93_ZPchr0014g46908 [Zizania palustris]
MDQREWMYTGRPSQAEVTMDWIKNTEVFLETAFGRRNVRDKTWCPCSRCENKRRQTKDAMGKHLCKYGFMPNYTRWTYHGESQRPREEVLRHRMDDDEGGVGFMLDDFEDAHFDEAREEEVPEPTAKAFYDMLSASKQPLHGHTKVSQLDAIARLLAIKSQFSLSRECFDVMLTVVGSLLPEGHNLPKSMYESKKVLRALKMPYEQIHACPNGCILFRKQYADATCCVKCKSSRYLEVDSDDGVKKQLSIPVKILRYLPFVPRIQRLYMTEECSKQMTWHKNGIRYNPDKLGHPSDGEAWKKFDQLHPEKALEPRNVRIAIATDGFNPYGMTAAAYSCWPMFVIPLNLPPGVIFQRQNIFLSLIIPGPEYPGKNMSVYMEPLMDDLVHAWEDGVLTYDRCTKTNFRMHVWYMYSLHDLPAYSIFCGWCVHGKFACPICRSTLKFIWLAKGGKYSSFDKHRQFLPRNHPFRKDKRNFTKDVSVKGSAPIKMTGADVRAQLESLQINTQGAGFIGYGEHHAWTHKPCLWNLPYFDDLLLPHNIDVMHTEKNVAEAIFGTIMDIPEKTKDNVKARLDQAAICNRPKLDMIPPRSGKSWTKPKSDFVLTRGQRREVLEWFRTLMFPDGYAANLKRGVNLATLRINGLKSHDYHIWIERLLPVMIRGYVPEDVWRVLAELSNFFRQLCAKQLSHTVVADMETLAPVLLCKLEKIFPPGFFNPMQHMILHLPYEARMGGPVQSRWCYSIERFQKILRNKCKNKCKIEASIAEAYVLEEVSNFTTRYYADNLPSVHNPPARYNLPEEESNLSIFRGQLGSASGAANKTLQHEEWRLIMLYVLTNLSEVEPYIEEFHRRFWRGSREANIEESTALLKYGVGNGNPDFISWFKTKVFLKLTFS